MAPPRPVGWTEVASSALAAVAYDEGARALFLRFRSGGDYAYLDVPPATFAALLAAPSKGRAFHAEVDGRYRFTRLDRT